MTAQDAQLPDAKENEPQSMTAPGPVLLVIGMGIGSVMLWALSPIFWLWFAAQVAQWGDDGTRITPTLAVIILGGIIVSTIVLGKLLGIMNRKHMQLTGLDRGTKHARSWNKSLRDARQTTRDRGVLEPVMYVSLGLAGIAFGIGLALSRFVLPG